MNFLTNINLAFKGTPDLVLTVVLVSLGLFAIGVAFLGDPAFKALLAAWLVFP